MELPAPVHLTVNISQTMKTGIITLILIVCAAWTAPQRRAITGVISKDNSGAAMNGVAITVKGTTATSVSDSKGKYTIQADDKDVLVFERKGFVRQETVVGSRSVINIRMIADAKSMPDSTSKDDAELQEVVVTGQRAKKTTHVVANGIATAPTTGQPQPLALNIAQEPQEEFNTEEYKGITENIFHDALRNPLSTFSIDVDAASYSNVRRFINNGQRPPKDAVRIEEMINYFHYEYPQPKGEDPFAIVTEMSTAPWNPKHKLVHIGLQGKIIATDNLPPSNLVFLIDVSGSMSDVNKLPLLKASFKLLVEQLREQDHVAIVVYAGAAGLVLPSTSGADKKTIIAALDNLQAGGSTAGGAGIRLAYAVAKENFRTNGNNRVIIATDGDFNVGESSDASMEHLIEEKRGDGIFLTVLGYGMGNYKDSKMEVLADKGNGNYAYIDTILEAQKVLVNEFGGTLFTIAKDVKLQIEFNPARVKAYRLIGYENRVLKNEDFNNDKKDAGDLGSGHTVTALYEIIPVGVDSEFFKIDELKYQSQKIEPAANSAELMTVKFRYKKPNEDVSKLIIKSLTDDSTEIGKTSDNFRWSAAVAGFGMILRESEYAKGFTINQVLELAQGSKGKDSEGYRIEFINLVRSQALVASR